jgi:ATP-dependent Clp protease ATP-binding subunit ClpC
MFERYTESARRALFFARYETTQLGGTAIEAEHVLLGLLREIDGVAAKILAHAHVSVDSLWNEIEERVASRKKVGTSVEIPFSPETKRALQFAAEEADRLRHKHIGPEHLLLGLLREGTSVAGSVLVQRGVRLDQTRNLIAQWSEDSPTGSSDGRAFDQIESLHQLVSQLAAMIPEHEQTRALTTRIHAGLDRLKWRHEHS